MESIREIEKNMVQPLNALSERSGNSVTGGPSRHAVRFRGGGRKRESSAGGRSGGRQTVPEKRREGRGGQGAEERRAEGRRRGRSGNGSRGVDGAQRCLRSARSGDASRPAARRRPMSRPGWSRDPSVSPASGDPSRRESELRATREWRWQARWSL